MRKLQSIILAACVFLVAGPVNDLYAASMQVEMGTSFTCTSNAECKRKCEALGGRWKSNKGGSTWGSCSLRAKVLADQVIFLQEQLMKEKKVADWSQAGVKDPVVVVNLTPSECDALGGDVDYHLWCSTTRLKCTTTDANGVKRAICIDEMDAK